MLGELIGNYRLISVLGEGGMGVVYLAEHVHLGRRAAIKLLLPELSISQDGIARFFNEARATTMIRHPGLVEVYDFGYHTTGAAYIAMEFLEGESLGACLRRQMLPRETALGFVHQVAEVMAAAHDKGIVHRDLKPDNVYLVVDPTAPGGVRVKVLDFGIAKLATSGATASALKTRTGSVLGTPMYMSPEQCRGAGQVDHRSDVYSLGCILFEMLCQRTPFLGEGPGDVIAAHLREPAPSPRALQPSLPPRLDGLVLRALAKRPEERPQSMRELGAELQVAMAESRLGTVNHPPDTYVPAPKVPTTLGGATGQVQTEVPQRRGRRLLLPAGLLVAVGAAVALIAMRPSGEPPSGQPPSGQPVKAALPAPPDTTATPDTTAPPDAMAMPDAAVPDATPDAMATPDAAPLPPDAAPAKVEKRTRRSGRHIKDGTIDPFGGR